MLVTVSGFSLWSNSHISHVICSLSLSFTPHPTNHPSHCKIEKGLYLRHTPTTTTNNTLPALQTPTTWRGSCPSTPATSAAATTRWRRHNRTPINTLASMLETKLRFDGRLHADMTSKHCTSFLNLFILPNKGAWSCTILLFQFSLACDTKSSKAYFL